MLRTKACAIVVAAGAVLWNGPSATASTIGIVPTRIEVSGPAATADLTVENEGGDAVTYAVRGFRWHQGPSGNVELEAADELVVYPQRFTLEGGDKRPVRIGFTGAPAAAEQSYRITVTEIASSTDAARTGTVLTVRNRVSVSLFIAPDVAATVRQASAKNANVDPANASFSLEAAGNVHLFATSVTFEARDASGASVLRQTLPGWYLLPGEPRNYGVPLAAGLCARVRSFVIDATFEAGPPLHAVVTPSRAC
jgi:P pilus assembly chaperone PapD